MCTLYVCTQGSSPLNGPITRPTRTYYKYVEKGLKTIENPGPGLDLELEARATPRNPGFRACRGHIYVYIVELHAGILASKRAIY